MGDGWNRQTNNQTNNQTNKNICIGLLAHVDAGKTTLSEGILYSCGAIRKIGRVDHRNAFFDTYEMERSRGITIFSKQAVFDLGDVRVTLLDTPGHVDFSAEMERTLQVLDYAILIVSGADGVQGHTQTLWKLLKHYHIPTFIFINKMDQPGTDEVRLMEELKKRLDSNCLDFSADRTQEDWQEQFAMCEEELLEAYLENGEVDEAEIPRLVCERKLFPCFFGSALKMEGVQAFLDGIKEMIRIPQYSSEFAAKVFKIARDTQGNRLTYMKITGGALKVKTLLTNQQVGLEKSEDLAAIARGKSEKIWEEKVEQIRVYSGEKFEAVQQGEAGMICAVTGLTSTYPGQALGAEKVSQLPVLEPVLTYQIRLPEGVDSYQTLLKLRQLEEEEPQLHIVWNEALEEIHAQVMGVVQIDVLKNLMQERFGIAVTFDSGSIVYKETIAEPVEGVGHYEPLRHYAEVHLLLEPGEAGSGLQFAADCSEDILDKNWQRLVLTHLEEKEHLGVLTGSPITDMRITLVTGKAHLKHTEGGDFRQATYRAVRHGLRKAESVLLEPYYEFRLEVPADMIGRGMTDIQKMNGSFEAPWIEGETAVLTGMAPVVLMRDYQNEVMAYSRGTGHLFCSLKGYFPCHNTEEIVESKGYDPEADLENPTSSVFCAHGAGFVVNWDLVENYMHLESPLHLKTKKREEEFAMRELSNLTWKEEQARYAASEKELEEIFARTYGSGKGDDDRRERKGWRRSRQDREFQRQRMSSSENYTPKKNKSLPPEQECLLVDGYNIIFAWEDLNELAKSNVDAARDKLMDILSDYQAYKKCTLILVFDAYKVQGNPGSVQKINNIYVVFTKEAETADQYIEKTVHDMSKKYHVTVATSDRLEQIIIWGQGAVRMAAKELREEIELTKQQIREDALARRNAQDKNYLFDHLDEEMAQYMEDVRLGKRKL